jgi:hypothetical protein
MLPSRNDGRVFDCKNPPTKTYCSVKHLKVLIFFRLPLISTCHGDDHTWQPCVNKTIIHVGTDPLAHHGSVSMPNYCWM